MLTASGDQVGKVRDVVLQNCPSNCTAARPGGRAALRRIFFRWSGCIPSTSTVDHLWRSTPAASSRANLESLAIDDLFDRSSKPYNEPFIIYDLAIKHVRQRDWELSEVVA